MHRAYESHVMNVRGDNKVVLTLVQGFLSQNNPEFYDESVIVYKVFYRE